MVYPVSYLSFDYSGYRNGTFSAVGEMPNTDTTVKRNHDWAIGIKSGTAQKIEFLNIETKVELSIRANVNPIQSALYQENISIIIYNPKVGTFFLRNGSAGVSFNSVKGVSSESFGFLSGQVEFTTFQDERAIGTFHGVAEIGGLAYDSLDTKIYIENGEFNMRVERENLPH